LKATEIKKALDPQIKRASQNVVKKIKTNIIKKNQMKNMTPKGSGEAPRGVFDDLRDIVTIKKQKAVANELDSLIYDQKQEKEKRDEKEINNKSPPIPSPMDTYLKNNPEKAMKEIKEMSMKDAIKMSMITNKSGGSDAALTAMLLEKGNNNGDGGGLKDKIIGHLLDKAFNNNGNNQKESSNNELIKFMMQQNLQNQQLLIKVIEDKKSTPTNSSNNDFMKEILGMVKSQGDFENSFLRDKLRDMEQRIQPTDSLGEAKRVMDFMGGFKTFFGATPQTPDGLNHELKMKELEYEQNRQINEEHMRTKRMDNLTEMINTAIGGIGKVLSEPIAEAAKAKVEQFTEGVKHPEEKRKEKRLKVSPERLRNEIDLGDIESLEDEIAGFSEKPRKKRFYVHENNKTKKKTI